MKKILFLLGLSLLISTFSYAQCSKSCAHKCDKSSLTVPTVVKDGLAELYPGANNVKWKKKEGNYQAAFNVSDNKTIVLIDAKGKVLLVEVALDKTDLPKDILAHLESKHKDAKFKKAKKIIKDGKTHFEVVLKEDGESTTLLFDEKGELIKE